VGSGKIRRFLFSAGFSFITASTSDSVLWAMGRFMNDELESILTEMVVAYLIKCPGTCTEGLKKTTTAAD
jgi:hypothetical protein